MTAKSGLAMLFCVECKEQTLHRGLACIHCQTANKLSGAPPIKREAALKFGDQKPDAAQARIEGIAARNRARAARKQTITRMRA